MVKPTKSVFYFTQDRRTILNQRLWAKVEKTDSCWNWIADKDSSGYGRLWYTPKRWLLAHRTAYELTKGTIPQDFTIDHLCRNKRCVNPDHLEAVTHRENVLRGIGPTAMNHKKEYCKNGHLLSSDNLVVWLLKVGYRGCLKCTRDYGRLYMRKRRSRN